MLRRPSTIVAEVLTIAVACAAMTVVPQQGEATALDFHHFEADWPRLAGVVQAIALDRVTEAPWFLALVALASASLALVLVEQVQLLRRGWGQPADEWALRGAPFELEFERPSRVSPPLALGQTGRVGLAGSPLLHLGLLLCVIAGLVQMVVAHSAVVDVVEGETLAAGVADLWSRQWAGPLAPALALDEPLTFQSLRDERYPSGALKELAARVRLGQGAASREVEIAVNTPLDLGAVRLYLTSMGGTAALVEVGSGVAKPVALLLRPVGDDAEEYSGEVAGMELHLRAGRSKTGAMPQQVHLRVLHGGGLRYSGPVAVNEGAGLADGKRFVLRDLRRWSQFRARRDDALGLAWCGLATGLLGALLIYGVSPTLWMVRVEPLGDRDRVLVKMKPLRFAPLHRERFARLVQREGGPALAREGDA
ncbi:MAG: cytochrome c biogenesis protein ResB [Deltaproteobacteria bacterium]|nr:cytochrome c biogenesis protein ResB [Deltaproteobacteria bacterium]